MNILIANDDGVFAPGIQALADALKPLGRVVVVAPESERSGFSSALTLDRPYVLFKLLKMYGLLMEHQPIVFIYP